MERMHGNLPMAQAVTFNASARRLGMVAAVGSVLLIAAYAVTLVTGLRSLPSPREPMGDPWFSILEVLIILLMPPMVALMVAVHAWAPAEVKVFSLTALVFMALMAGLTSSLHFVILTVGRSAAFSGLPWMPLFLSFSWPSVPYALDILAWDVFFPLSVMFAAKVFSGSRLTRTIRVMLLASGAFALAGLSGLVANDMRLRNIGILGYVGVFPVAALLLVVLFNRAKPQEACAMRP